MGTLRNQRQEEVVPSVRGVGVVGGQNQSPHRPEWRREKSGVTIVDNLWPGWTGQVKLSRPRQCGLVMPSPVRLRPGRTVPLMSALLHKPWGRPGHKLHPVYPICKRVLVDLSCTLALKSMLVNWRSRLVTRGRLQAVSRTQNRVLQPRHP